MRVQFLGLTVWHLPSWVLSPAPQQRGEQRDPAPHAPPRLQPDPPGTSAYLKQGRQQRQQGPRRSRYPAHGGGEGPSEEPEAAVAAAAAAAEHQQRRGDGSGQWPPLPFPSPPHPLLRCSALPANESELVTNSGPQSPPDSHQE